MKSIILLLIALLISCNNINQKQRLTSITPGFYKTDVDSYTNSVLYLRLQKSGIFALYINNMLVNKGRWYTKNDVLCLNNECSSINTISNRSFVMYDYISKEWVLYTK